MKKLLYLLCALWISGGVADAQLNQRLKGEFHESEAHGAKIVDSKSSLRAALADDKVKVLCFQSFGETLEPADLQGVFDWVRAGKTVWFYDTRLASLFGMREVRMTAEQFRNKPEEGVLGGKKRKGLATVTLSLGSHPVQTGVGQVTVFLPELKAPGASEAEYGGIEVAGDTVGLLQFAVDSPALAACRREGRGMIVFKSLLWNEPLSGDRFQLNLLEFSSGHQVPDLAGVGKVGSPPGPDAEYIEGAPAVSLMVENSESPSVSSVTTSTSQPTNKAKVGGWSLRLQNGSVLEGQLEMKVIEFETAKASLKLAPDQIRELVFGDSIRLDTLTTSDGKKQSGLLLSQPIRVRTASGIEEFEKEDLTMMTRSDEK